MNIEIFKEQIGFIPEIENKKDFLYDNVVIGGMGGSGLTARILFFLDPIFPIWLHDDFGMPEKTEGKTLFIAISHSGNTKETLSFAEEVINKNLPLYIITSGGRLLEMAKEKNLPYVLIPNKYQPRDSITYMLKAVLNILVRTDLMKEIESLNLDNIENINIGDDFAYSIPLIYTSRQNKILGYIWKIIMNETAKLPAFTNAFPELTHNEIQGIVPETSKGLSEKAKVLLLLDKEDNAGVSKEMEAFMEVSKENNINISYVNLPTGKINKLFYTLVIARETAHKIAEIKGTPADEVPFIESFKQKLK